MQQPTKDEDARHSRSLAQAIATALALVGLIALFYLLGVNAFFGLVVVVVLIALFEMLDGVAQAGHRPVIPFGLAAGSAMLLVARWQHPGLLVLVLGLTVAGAFLLALRPSRGPHPSTDAAWTLLGVAWIGGGGAGAVFILALEPAGLRLLIGSVLVVALSDIGAYFAGTRLGRHKLAPAISPGKSWEGVIGGAAAALAGGAIFGSIVEVISVVDGVAIGAICSLLAPVGDLVESMFKREVGIKDSGRLLPGHGGVLDRIDAILFCAPAVYLYLFFVAFGARVGLA